MFRLFYCVISLFFIHFFFIKALFFLLWSHFLPQRSSPASHSFSILTYYSDPCFSFLSQIFHGLLVANTDWSPSSSFLLMTRTDSPAAPWWHCVRSAWSRAPIWIILRFSIFCSAKATPSGCIFLCFSHSWWIPGACQQRSRSLFPRFVVTAESAASRRNVDAWTEFSTWPSVRGKHSACSPKIHQRQLSCLRLARAASLHVSLITWDSFLENRLPGRS